MLAQTQKRKIQTGTWDFWITIIARDKREIVSFKGCHKIYERRLYLLLHLTKFEDSVTHLKYPIDIIIIGLSSAKKRVLKPGLGIGITLRVFSE